MLSSFNKLQAYYAWYLVVGDANLSVMQFSTFKSYNVCFHMAIDRHVTPGPHDNQNLSSVVVWLHKLCCRGRGVQCFKRNIASMSPLLCPAAAGKRGKKLTEAARRAEAAGSCQGSCCGKCRASSYSDSSHTCCSCSVICSFSAAPQRPSCHISSVS